MTDPKKTTDSDSSWEAILNEVLDEPEDEGAIRPLALGPVRAQVRPDDLERAMVEEEGLGQPPAPPPVPAKEDLDDVRRLLAKGSTAAAQRTSRQSIATAFKDMASYMPERTRRRRTRVKPRDVFRRFRHLHRLPQLLKAAFRRWFDQLLERSLAANKVLHRAGLEWKDLACVSGLMLILAVLINFFAPEIKAMLQ